jgi:hypothetical protein
MSEFIGKFLLERGIGKDSWQLYRPLVYRSSFLRRDILVPKGFTTDFASIPRFFHRLLPKNGEYDAAAVVHDWLYAKAPEVFPGADESTMKMIADLVFLEAMKAIGVPWWKRTVMYEAVNWGGFMAWRGHRRNDEAELPEEVDAQ